MTTIGEPDKINLKASIPIIICFIVGGIGIWFLPERRCYFYADNIFWNYILPSLGSLTSIIGILMILTWTKVKVRNGRE